jgi:hypothetical protein
MRGAAKASAAAAMAPGHLTAALSSKHAQWEHELMQELARHREEQRASRAATSYAAAAASNARR